MTITLTPRQAIELQAIAETSPEGAALVERELTRLEAINRYPTAGALGVALDPRNNRQVPWLQRLDAELEWAFATPDARLMISTPSQQGKSSRAVVLGAVRALILNPDWRIIIATHSEELALSHSERIRTLLRTYGTGAKDAQTGMLLTDRLGIGIGDKAAAGRWTLAGHSGGVVAVGVGTALPGKACDCMFLDDLHPGMKSADSPPDQRTLRLWWEGSAKQRLAPGAPVISIGTRWSIHDAFSYLLEQEPRRWRVLNFPAIAQAGVLDSLGREPGVPLESARGDIDWEYLRATTPARVWSATYQGSPVPAEGGLFAAAWFDQRIHDDEPPQLFRKIVAVDPADSGVGDKTGIIAMGITADGTIVLTHDDTALMTSDEWAAKAVQLATQTGASEIVFEAFTVATTYARLLSDAAKKAGVRVKITPWKMRGTAAVRATGLANAIETGKARVWGHRLAQFETDATTWLGEGTHCPDSVAAAVAGFEHLVPRTTSRAGLPSRDRFSRRLG